MVRQRRFLLISCIALSAMLLASCSDAQNRTEEPEPNAALAMKVVSTSTTDGATTTETFDDTLEKTISSSLTKVFISGTSDKDLFDKTIVDSATTDFTNNKEAKDNSVEVSLHLMKNADAESDLIVAQVSQELETKAGAKVSREGKIYLNEKGTVIGFSFPDAEAGTTAPTTKGA